MVTKICLNTCFQTFLSGTPARDYVFQQIPYEEQIRQAAKLIREADYLLIGAGAGLSAAAGLTMGGSRFTDNFKEFIERYGGPYMKDMYSAGFYPFETEEAKWGYWSKNCMVNRVLPGTLPLYKKVYELTQDKKYFVLTTNVDHQFYLSGFGDDKARKDCLVPSYMVPKCPVCGGPMEMNLRCDQYFVEDEAWHEAEQRFGEFISECNDKRTVLLELGVGFNTPTIIRFPFEKLVRENEKMSLIRLNLDEAVVPESFGERAVGINEDMVKSINDLQKEVRKYEAE